MSSKEKYLSVFFFGLVPGVLTFIYLYSYFDLFYWLLPIIFLMSLISSSMRKALSGFKDHMGYKIMEIILLAVCISIIGFIFSFHNSTRENDDPPTERGDPFKWARASNIITHPIRQIRNKYSPPVQKVRFVNDTTDIIHFIVVDATFYKSDSDANIMNFKNLSNFLKDRVKSSCGITPYPFDLRNSVAKFLVCKSYENLYKSPLARSARTSLLYYIGDDSVYNLKSSLIHEASNLKKILEADYQDCITTILQKGINSNNQFTNFQKLFELIQTNFFERREVLDNPNSKISFSIVSDFLDEGVKGNKTNKNSVFDTGEAFSKIVNNPKVVRINLIKATSFSANNQPGNAADILPFLQTKIGQDKELSVIDLNQSDFLFVKYKLESCFYPVHYNPYDKMNFYFPYDGTGTNSIRKTKIQFSMGEQENVSFAFLTKGKEATGFSVALNVLNERNESALAVPLNSTGCFLNCEDSLLTLWCDNDAFFNQNQNLSLIVSSNKIGVSNKYDIIFIENNSYFNPTLLGVFYALASTSYVYIFLSPFIYLFWYLYSNKQVSLKQFFRGALFFSAIISSAFIFYFYYVAKETVTLNFKYFFLPLIISILPLCIASFLLLKKPK